MALLAACCCPHLTAQDFGRRERHVDILHYDINVLPDPESASLRGDVTIIARSLRDTLHTVTLDAVDMRIDSVSVMGKRSAFVYDSSSLRIALDRVHGYADTVTLRVYYWCMPRRGMYFIKPDSSFPNDPVQIWTQGQREDNRHWLPSYDFPNDKASSELRITIDSTLMTLSNGTLLSREDNGDGTHTWHWSQSTPHSSYLIMLAAGQYRVYEDSYDGIPVQSWYYDRHDFADVHRSYVNTTAMLRFFSNEIGVTYPWEKYVQIPVAHFPYGGMENTSATVLADTRVVYDARASLDYNAEALIAHELAHQWWGNYVTYIDWSNEWLNEGFATYYQQLWTLERYGKDDFDVQRHDGIQHYLNWTDRAGRVPVVYHQRNSSANTYAKGAAVLHMLHDMLGDELYRRVMNEYITRHAYGNVETNDLKRCIDDVTGLNLHWFFSQWLYKAGYPELHVSSRWDDAGRRLVMHIRQVQHIDSICGRFRFPLTILAVDAQGRETPFRVEIMGPDTLIHLPLAVQPVRVEIDPDNVLCGRIMIEQSDEEVIASLRHSRNIAIRLRAVAELGKRVANGVSILAALYECARNDSHTAVRRAAASVCAELDTSLVTNGTALKQLFLDLRSDKVSVLRALAYSGLRKFRDPELRDLFMQGMQDSSYHVEAAAMNCLLDADTTGGWDVVKARLASSSYGDIVTLSALDWVDLFPSADAVRIVHRLAGPGNSLQVRSKAMSVLLRLGVSYGFMHTLLVNTLTEPRYQFRLLAVSVLPVLGKETAHRVAREHRSVEKDPRVLHRIDAMLAGE